MNYKYRVYLKTFDGSKIDRVLCDNIEEVEIVLENAEEYFSYIIVRYDIKLNMDEVFERGQIQRNINKVKTLSKQNKNRKR